jgi:hypothetical protein
MCRIIQGSASHVPRAECLFGWLDRNRNKFWATDKSDGFAWQFRVSEVEDQELGNAYINQVRQSVQD